MLTVNQKRQTNFPNLFVKKQSKWGQDLGCTILVNIRAWAYRIQKFAGPGMQKIKKIFTIF